MKVKLLSGPLLIVLLTAVSAMLILTVPWTFLKIIAGLPLILYFPGYSLLSALFVKKDGPGNLQWITISFGMSIAISTLIGLGLNYTSWGITLESTLLSISAFIVLLSVIKAIRLLRTDDDTMLSTSTRFTIPGFDGSNTNRVLSAFTGIAVLVTVVIMAYFALEPKQGEKFTEFYILGINGIAYDYPTTIILQGSRVTSVVYDDGSAVSASSGKVTLGIVNNEQSPATYSIKLSIDGQPADIILQGTSSESISGIELGAGKTWEEQIGFIAYHLGDNQRVEFSLFKNSNQTPQDSVYFWINVVEPGQ